jgi:hypothetical protein
MRCPRMTAGAGDRWLPRLLLGVGVRFDIVGATRKVATYGDYSQEAYEWRTWTDTKNIRVVCIRFPL